MKIKGATAFRSILCAAVLGGWTALSCSGEFKSVVSGNETAGMAVEAPEGYPNARAAQKNRDGMDHLVFEHWAKAAADFRRALSEDPGLAAAHFNLALSLDRMGEPEEAAAHFQRALELAPEDARISGNEILKKHTGRSAKTPG